MLVFGNRTKSIVISYFLKLCSVFPTLNLSLAFLWKKKSHLLRNNRCFGFCQGCLASFFDQFVSLKGKNGQPKLKQIQLIRYITRNHSARGPGMSACGIFWIPHHWKIPRELNLFLVFSKFVSSSRKLKFKWSTRIANIWVDLAKEFRKTPELNNLMKSKGHCVTVLKTENNSLVKDWWFLCRKM